MSVKEALDNFAFDVIDEAKKILDKKDKNASKKLSDSLDYKLKVSAKKDNFALTFLMEDYAEYIDRGVKGKGGTKADGTQWKKKRISNISIWKQRTGYKDERPPASAFSNWVVRRGIAPRNKKGQFMTRKSLMFAIATSVYHTGQAATNFFTLPFNRYLKGLPDRLAISVADELVLKLKL